MDMDLIASWFSANQAISTLILIASFILLRKLSESILRGHAEVLSEDRRRLLTYSRNALVLVLVIGLALIWAPALRTFALSVTAFFVALVIATKELILCLTGGLLRTSAGAFRVGDWVRIGEIRGEVIDLSIMSVTLQELESTPGYHTFTGRTVTLPNSIFLSAAVVNENFYKKFVYHTITITLDKDDDPTAVADIMMCGLQDALQPHHDVARRYNSLITRRAGIEMPAIGPRTRFSTSPEGRPRVMATAFMPTHEIENIERSVLERVFTAIRAARTSPATTTHT